MWRVRLQQAIRLSIGRELPERRDWHRLCKRLGKPSAVCQGTASACRKLVSMRAALAAGECATELFRTLLSGEAANPFIQQRLVFE